MSNRSLKGKAVLVGGGAKNLGGLISRTFATDGARICVHYNSASTKKEADKTVADIKAGGGEAFSVQGNFTKVGDVEAAFASKETIWWNRHRHQHGGQSTAKTDRRDDRRRVRHDVRRQRQSGLLFHQAGWHRSEPRRQDHHSCDFTIGRFHRRVSTYAGGKAPVEDFTRAAAKEFGGRGISVNAIGPGPMDTPFFYGQETPERVAYHKSQSMNGELTKIEDIVPVVKFLATDGWWITGQTIFANGGYTTR